ncbi:MAG TPA: non-canonical purine NTP pyrophosphatase, partial [Phycisphaerales bacterium]|nr:non-canonical purine NTP pyrophosphatase [Phycisphaerales bacterium]
GENGFGYDPVFYVPDLGRTVAELSREQKNAISHRARAVATMRPHLVRLLSG